MKHITKRLMIIALVLLGAVLFTGTNASAVIVGTAPVGTTTIIGPVPPSSVSPFGLAPRPLVGFPPGLVKQPAFNPFVIRPIFNPFLIRPIFNPFLDADDLGLGLGLNPGLGAD